MNYKDYQNARDVAWQILIDCKVDTMPVKISQVCRQLGVSVHFYDPKDGNDGMSLLVDGQPIILVSRRAPASRQRFTVAHELGHIVLGHVGRHKLYAREPSPTDSPIEHAANVFASRLLAPACVLWGCDAWDAGSIARMCDISIPSATFRAERLSLLRERRAFLMSPLEQQVYQQFLPFIARYRSAGGN